MSEKLELQKEIDSLCDELRAYPKRKDLIIVIKSLRKELEGLQKTKRKILKAYTCLVCGKKRSSVNLEKVCSYCVRREEKELAKIEKARKKALRIDQKARKTIGKMEFKNLQAFLNYQGLVVDRIESTPIRIDSNEFPIMNLPDFTQKFNYFGGI